MRMNTGLLKRLSTGITLILALALSSLCVASSSSPTLDRVIEQGVLRVAMTGEQQPFNYVYAKSGAVIGFDVDLAEALAGMMNVKLEISRMPFEKLLAALDKGEVDLVISGMSITPERTREVSFVGPYMLSGKSLLTTVKLMREKGTSAEFDSPGIKLVALSGSTSEGFVRRKLSKASLTTTENYDGAVQLLLAGKADGMVADMPILALTKKRHPESDLYMVTPPLSTEPIGIAIGRDDEQFENLLGNYLSAFRESGLLVNLHKKWF